jgi:1-aminocyclopropane-1-carboxylate deaminase/D-cysteine desulfhydrase-like pyridoxal-dependent ACC family enzyme
MSTVTAVSFFSTAFGKIHLNSIRQILVDKVNIKTVGIVVAASSFLMVSAAIASGIFLLRRISSSVGLAEPLEKQLQEESPETNCALFRHLPQLVKKLAFRSLGAAKSSPIHVCTLPKENLKFFVKREDLISPIYGGNKVRTLQHQLAVLEARRERGDVAAKQIVPLGSGGSNQVVATVVHAKRLGWDNQNIDDDDKDSNSNCTVNACWFDSDEPDFDNTLNYLSVLSFPNVAYTFDWGMSPSILRACSAIKGVITQQEFVPLMMGGNCPAGVLGQVGGILELAEQIERGDSPDIDRIYLPIGSSCTVSGLILGTVLARHLRMQAFTNPNLKIVGCNVHDGFAMLDRKINMHINPMFQFLPLTITHTVLGACTALKKLGGPDLSAKCKEFIQTSVELRSQADIVGKYGAHSEKTREAALYYDEHGVMTDYKTGTVEKELWVCGHFVAKAFQPLIKDLEAAITQSPHLAPPKYMLWQTKSAIQPKGPLNEWEKMMNQNEKVKKWANQGKAESRYRPGMVSTVEGKPEDYRSVMTSISL